MNVIKEVCVESAKEAKTAELKNADRVELCSRLDLDGLTPHRLIIQETINSLTIPVKVMIRPKDGDFIYSKKDIIKMRSEIEFCKSIGVGEVVFGVLNKNGQIDIDLSHLLAKAALPMKVTFHKAIDHTIDIILELKRLSKVKEVTSILTSGGEDSAFNGKDTIKQIITEFSSRFNIISAGGITDINFDVVHNSIGGTEYHGKRILGQLG